MTVDDKFSIDSKIVLVALFILQKGFVIILEPTNTAQLVELDEMVTAGGKMT